MFSQFQRMDTTLMNLSPLPCSCFHHPAGMPFPGQAALQDHKALPARTPRGEHRAQAVPTLLLPSPSSPSSSHASSITKVCWKKSACGAGRRQGSRTSLTAGSCREENGAEHTINSIERGRKLIFLDYFPVH